MCASFRVEKDRHIHHAQSDGVLCGIVRPKANDVNVKSCDYVHWKFIFICYTCFFIILHKETEQMRRRKGCDDDHSGMVFHIGGSS